MVESVCAAGDGNLGFDEHECQRVFLKADPTLPYITPSMTVFSKKGAHGAAWR